VQPLKRHPGRKQILILSHALSITFCERLIELSPLLPSAALPRFSSSYSTHETHQNVVDFKGIEAYGSKINRFCQTSCQVCKMWETYGDTPTVRYATVSNFSSQPDEAAAQDLYPLLLEDAAKPLTSAKFPRHLLPTSQK
jgi:hypothetical protein